MAKSFDELARRTMTPKMRARAALRTRELLGEYLLSEICAGRGKSQVELAAAFGVKQPSLLKLEKLSDMRVSTLAKIVKALGGELEIVIRFPKGGVRNTPFGMKRSRSHAALKKLASLS